MNNPNIHNFKSLIVNKLEPEMLECDRNSENLNGLDCLRMEIKATEDGLKDTELEAFNKQ